MKKLDLNMVNFIVEEMYKITKDPNRLPSDKLKAIYILKALEERELI